MPYMQVEDIPFEGTVGEDGVLEIATGQINGGLEMVEVLVEGNANSIVLKFREKVIVEDKHPQPANYYFPEAQTNNPDPLAPFNTFGTTSYCLNDPLKILVEGTQGTIIRGIARYV